MTTQVPLGIQAFSDRLHFRCIGPMRAGRFESFLVDLADWKLSLTDRTPCLWIHNPELLSLPVVDLVDEILDVVRQQRWQNDTVLIMSDEPDDDLHKHLRSSFTAFIVLSSKQQLKIHSSESPTREALEIFIRQIPRTRLAPYETSRPVTGSRFFGRQDYIRRILSNTDKNYFLTGVRRIGKTSLLHEIKRLLDQKDPPKPDETRRLYIDCSVIQSETEFYREIVSRLNPPGLKQLSRESQSRRYQSQIFEHLADRHGGPITYLLDEIDLLLEDLGADSDFFNVLRRASAQDVARFVLAGFRFAERAATDIGTPFYNFGELLRLKSFTRNEARQIVELPMDQLRVRLQGREEIVKRIFQETSGLPNLIQFYCQTLVEEMENDGRDSISPDDLQAIYNNLTFRDFVIQTFTTNATPLERAIIFAMVSKVKDSEPFTIEQVDGELNRRGLNISFNQLDDACNNLERAGYLIKREKNFSFSVPLFGRMLEENYPIEYAFRKARRESITSGAQT